MGIEKVTPHPALYIDEPEAWELEELEAKKEEQWKQLSSGKFWVAAELRQRHGFTLDYLSTAERKQAAQLVSSKLGKDAVFDRREDCYRIDKWSVTKYGVVSELYNIKNRTRCGQVFSTLDDAGYKPNGEISVFYRPEPFDLENLTMLMLFVGQKSKYIEKRLGLSDEPRLIVHEDVIELCISMERFHYRKIEESLLLFELLIQMTDMQHQTGIAVG